MLNATWHQGHVMPKNATAAQRLAWHLQHEKHCGCRRLSDAQRAKLEESVAKAKLAQPKINRRAAR